MHGLQRVPEAEYEEMFAKWGPKNSKIAGFEEESKDTLENRLQIISKRYKLFRKK